MKTQNDFNTVLTEPTAVRANPVTAGKKTAPLWQSVLVGGVPGILIGAGGTLAAEALAKSAPDVVEPDGLAEGEVKEEIVDQPAIIREAYSVNDGMSFKEAFDAARAEVGPGGAFSWHGQVYGTHDVTDPEWLEMSDAERAAFSKEILAQVHARPYIPAENEPEIVVVAEGTTEEPVAEEVVEEITGMPVEENTAEEETVETPVEETEEAPVAEETVEVPVVEEDEEDEDDLDVHIVGRGDGVDVFSDMNGDQTAVFTDADGDDVVDTVLIEVDGEMTGEECVDADEIEVMPEPETPVDIDLADFSNGGDVEFSL